MKILKQVGPKLELIMVDFKVYMSRLVQSNIVYIFFIS